MERGATAHDFPIRSKRDPLKSKVKNALGKIDISRNAEWRLVSRKDVKNQAQDLSKVHYCQLTEPNHTLHACTSKWGKCK